MTELRTFEQLMTGSLTDCGLSEDEAREVTERTKATYEMMLGRWDEYAGEHSIATIQRLSIVMVGETIKWMDANRPDHPARANFTEKPTAPAAEPAGPS